MGYNKHFRKKSDIVFDTVVHVVVFIIIVMTLYPMIYVLSLSFSSAAAVETKQVWLLPIGFNINSYLILANHPYLAHSYFNTILYSVVGTSYSLLLTLFGAYALSRKVLIGKNFFMLLITFTMLFSGGLIPTFLVVNNLGMYNTRAAMIIPCAVSAFNLIIMRTFMQQIPDSMEESAKIDGANDVIILFKIYIPICIPSIATIGLFYFVGIWNDYYSALIYLSSQSLYPVQLVIRDLLITMSDNLVHQHLSNKRLNTYTAMGFKSAVVIVTMFPLMMIYPFIQKYFVKGLMIGSIKG